MDRAAPPPDGADRPDFDDARVEGILAGDPTAVAEHPELADLLADVRVAYGSGPLPHVGAPLAATLDLAMLEPTARSTTMALTAPRRLARFALAVVVTAIASGGLALAGALPGTLSDDVSDPTETTVETTVPETTPDTEPSESDDADGEESEYKNHGQEVSDFARTTELEGCEKGRAVSELASGKDLSHRPPCPSHDDDEVDDPDTDEVDEVDEVDDDEVDDDEDVESSDATPRGNARGHDKRD
ncbi:MAG TPA: hypothetical protein VFZ83_07475 [Acidimicrobiia bacterium]|nr:hypothetical protein [Acidimicrobiia bacterium]